jgi:hypothetical protein
VLGDENGLERYSRKNHSMSLWRDPFTQRPCCARRNLALYMHDCGRRSRPINDGGNALLSEARRQFGGDAGRAGPIRKARAAHGDFDFGHPAPLRGAIQPHRSARVELSGDAQQTMPKDPLPHARRANPTCGGTLVENTDDMREETASAAECGEAAGEKSIIRPHTHTSQMI